MASFSSASRLFSFTLLFFFFMASMVLGFRFEVGGEKGWVVPTGNEVETYNQWAARQRFNIGDTLYFKYQNDSVLEVGGIDYKACNTSNPLARYEKGSTEYQFERSGFFYFISGQEDHCKSGQRLIIRVIHPTDETEQPPVPTPSPSPSSAPSLETSPGSSGGDIGESAGDLGAASSIGSTIKLNVSSFFLTAFGVMFVSFYRVV